MPLNLDYFYGNEAEQYSFYRIPKALFTDAHYKAVTVEAKVLYGLLLDRMSLSQRNGWLDSDKRVFIYFTLEDAMEQMNCGKDKAVKLFKELDAATGIGLIERRKQGQGRPTRIYVKNFVLPLEPGEAPSEPDPTPAPVQTSENPKSALRHPAEVLTSEKPKSGVLENRSQDFGKPDPNKTEINKTDLSDTDPSFPSSPLPAGQPCRARRNRKRGIGMDEIEDCRETIKENIDFDLLLAEHPLDADLLEGYLDLIVEVCCSQQEYIRISGQDQPAAVVKSRFLKLDKEHISYVLECLHNNTTLVKNVKAYTLAALYNAPVTIGQYYASQVSHDMAQGFA